MFELGWWQCNAVVEQDTNTPLNINALLQYCDTTATLPITAVRSNTHCTPPANTTANTTAMTTASTHCKDYCKDYCTPHYAVVGGWVGCQNLLHLSGRHLGPAGFMTSFMNSFLNVS